MNKQAKLRLAIYQKTLQLLYFLEITEKAFMEKSSHGINLLNTELKPICHLLALLGAHHILHISRIRVKP